MKLETSYLRAVHQYGFRWSKENALITGVVWDSDRNRAVLRVRFESDNEVDFVPLLSVEKGDFVITSSRDSWPATN